MKVVTILAGLALVLSLTANASALLTETQTFDDQASASAAGWASGGVDNGGNPAPSQVGWVNSNNAGGASGAGEAGGPHDFIGYPDGTRFSQPRYYADVDLGGTVTDADTISANGVYKISSANASCDNVGLSHFTSTIVSGASDPLAAGLFIDDGGGGGDPTVYACLYGLKDGGGVWKHMPGSGVLQWTKGNSITWTYTYYGGVDPSHEKYRKVEAYFEQTDNPSNNITLTTNAMPTDAHFELDAFGIHGQQYWTGGNGNYYGDIFMDDVTYSSNVPEPATVAILGLGSLVLLRRRRA